MNLGDAVCKMCSKPHAAEVTRSSYKTCIIASVQTYQCSSTFSTATACENDALLTGYGCYSMGGLWYDLILGPQLLCGMESSVQNRIVKMHTTT